MGGESDGRDGGNCLCAETLTIMQPKNLAVAFRGLTAGTGAQIGINFLKKNVALQIGDAAETGLRLRVLSNLDRLYRDALPSLLAVLCLKVITDDVGGDGLEKSHNRVGMVWLKTAEDTKAVLAKLKVCFLDEIVNGLGIMGPGP